MNTSSEVCSVPYLASDSTVTIDRKTPVVTNSVETWGFPALIGFLLAFGIFLRLSLPAGFTGIGFDENLYRTYVGLLHTVGLGHYPTLTGAFLSNQLHPGNQAILPPTRVVYIVGGYIYSQVIGLNPLAALRLLSCHFSILTLVISAVFCWRSTRHRVFTITVTALMACAPTQIHLGQHALIDGVFGFWALLVVWLLWENLHRPNHAGWLIGYGLSLILLVMTKENAIFVFAALLGILLGNRWLKFGQVTRPLLFTAFGGALLGLLMVIIATGGVERFALVFILLKEKVPILPYTIATGGGPWHRYLIDLILVSPLVMILAISNLFRGTPSSIRGHGYLATFSCLSFAVLTVFPDGMNLRYIAMLDMPLRFLATSQLLGLSVSWGRYKNLFLGCAVLALCAYDLRQHHILFVKGGLYELVTEGLIRAQGIIK